MKYWELDIENCELKIGDFSVFISFKPPGWNILSETWEFSFLSDQLWYLFELEMVVSWKMSNVSQPSLNEIVIGIFYLPLIAIMGVLL